MLPWKIKIIQNFYCSQHHNETHFLPNTFSVYSVKLRIQYFCNYRCWFKFFPVNYQKHVHIQITHLLWENVVKWIEIILIGVICCNVGLNFIQCEVHCILQRYFWNMTPLSCQRISFLLADFTPFDRKINPHTIYVCHNRFPANKIFEFSNCLPRTRFKRIIIDYSSLINHWLCNTFETTTILRGDRRLRNSIDIIIVIRGSACIGDHNENFSRCLLARAIVICYWAVNGLYINHLDHF